MNRTSQHADVSMNDFKKKEDYFASDDSVIRSPTYYTRTQLNQPELLPSDLKSLLTPMWDEEQKTLD